jgi:hypothetical protein
MASVCRLRRDRQKLFRSAGRQHPCLIAHCDIEAGRLSRYLPGEVLNNRKNRICPTQISKMAKNECLLTKKLDF